MWCKFHFRGLFVGIRILSGSKERESSIQFLIMQEYFCPKNFEKIKMSLYYKGVLDTLRFPWTGEDSFPTFWPPEEVKPHDNR